MQKINKKILAVTGSLLLVIFCIVAVVTALKPRHKSDHIQNLLKLSDSLDRSIALIEGQENKIGSNARFDRYYVSDNVSITGILWDVDKPLALINDKVVGINDEIKEFKVVAITRDSVTLQDDKGQEKVNYLYDRKPF